MYIYIIFTKQLRTTIKTRAVIGWSKEQGTGQKGIEDEKKRRRKKLICRD